MKRSPGPFFKDGKIVKLGKIAQGIISDLEIDGRYVVKYELHNAKDFGIPQERERIIIVGIRKDISEKFELIFLISPVGEVGDQNHRFWWVKEPVENPNDDMFSAIQYHIFQLDFLASD